ncbi:hypothetical protein HMPREF3198_00858 [Winkia neuii]|nr:hypothetical protein HMPREF3198_00858 [Winkia neuii]
MLDRFLFLFGAPGWQRTVFLVLYTFGTWVHFRSIRHPPASTPQNGQNADKLFIKWTLVLG